MSVRIINAAEIGEGLFRITLACTRCKSLLGTEHRVDFDYEPLSSAGPSTREKRDASHAYGSSVRRENVRIMASGGCLDAEAELKTPTG